MSGTKQEDKINYHKMNLIKLYLDTPSINKMLIAHNIDKKEFAEDFAKEFDRVREIDETVYEFTTLDYEKMISGEYESGYIEGAKYCIVYETKGNNRRRPHTHCGNACRNYVCIDCSGTTTGKNIKEQIEKGTFSPEAYRQKYNTVRKSLASKKIKELGTEVLSLQVKQSQNCFILEDYQHSEKVSKTLLFAPTRLMYNSSLGLVIDYTLSGMTTRKTTIGIDEKNNGKIRKLNLEDIRKLKQHDLIFRKDTLEKKAFKYISRSFTK